MYVKDRLLGPGREAKHIPELLNENIQTSPYLFGKSCGLRIGATLEA